MKTKNILSDKKIKELSLIEKAFFLKKIRLFEELDLDLLVAIADKMGQDTFDAQDKVFEINGKASRMYFIVQGEVELLDENNLPFQTLSTTHFFGDEALFASTQRNYQALCLQNTLFLTLSKTDLMTIISECPSIAIALLEHYAKKTSCRHVPWKSEPVFFYSYCLLWSDQFYSSRLSFLIIGI